MGSFLWKGVIAYAIKEVITRVQGARQPKRNRFARFGVPGLIGSALVGGVSYLASTGRLPLPGKRSHPSAA